MDQVTFDKEWFGAQDERTILCLGARAGLRHLWELDSVPLKFRGGIVLNLLRAAMTSTVLAATGHKGLRDAMASIALKTPRSGGKYHQTLGHIRYMTYIGADWTSETLRGLLIGEMRIQSERDVISPELVIEVKREALASVLKGDESAAARHDFQSILAGKHKHSVFDAPLYLAEALPTRATDIWPKLPEDSNTWGFWRRWYFGLIIGKPLDWDIQLAVASLPDEDWEKGPEWVAGKIAEIEARFTLEDRIVNLEQALISESAQRRGIGDNHPPEPISDIRQVPPELVVVWEPLESLRQEAQADNPNEKTVIRAIKALASIAVSCGAWTWNKANMFLDTGAKAGGAAFGTTAVAFATGHGDKIVAVIKAALAWLPFIG